MGLEVEPHLRLIVGVDPAEPLLRLVADLASPRSEHGLPPRRSSRPAALEVPVPEPVVGTLGGDRVALLALVQRLVDGDELRLAAGQAPDPQPMEPEAGGADREDAQPAKERPSGTRCGRKLDLEGGRALAPRRLVVRGATTKPVAPGARLA